MQETYLVTRRPIREGTQVYGTLSSVPQGTSFHQSPGSPVSYVSVTHSSTPTPPERQAAEPPVSREGEWKPILLAVIPKPLPAVKWDTRRSTASEATVASAHHHLVRVKLLPP